MSLASFVTDFILGKPRQVTFQDACVGDLVATIRTQATNAWCLWHGQQCFEGQSRATHVSLSGDLKSPDRELLEELHRVVRGLARIETKADLELRKLNERASFRNFYLSSIVTHQRRRDDVGRRLVQDHERCERSWTRGTRARA
jgi:hypothetical protein